MKNTLLLCIAIAIASCQNNTNKSNTNAMNSETSSQASILKSNSVENIYQYKVKDINGEQFDFAALKGKKILVVNTASECGLTPQYRDLETIYRNYKDKNFIIVGFPANNFGSQEPGSNEEIAQFCQKNYGVSFPMMAKISVKGKDMHPLYKFLTSKSLNGLQDSEVQWNFQKYLINREGKLEKVIQPQTLPTDESIIKWINE